MDDCCAVCAEPLEWTAYGPCGHKDACSKCVTRLRFALGDTRCVICQQQSPAVVATRFMGTFTDTLPAEEFAQLKVGLNDWLQTFTPVGMLVQRQVLGCIWCLCLLR